MYNKTIKLSNKNPKIDIEIIKENPFFRVIGVSGLEEKFEFWDDTFDLKYYIIQGSNESWVNITEFKPFEIPVNDTDKITFEIKLKDEKEFELMLEYQLIDLIDVANPLITFNKHIDSIINTKIFFSAPFGQGKTFFLEYFFEQKKDVYNVFNVFPVNYSVADNKDIFKYIKVDLLFQLLEKGVEFEEEISKSLQIQSYVRENPKKLILPMLKIFSAIGGDPFSTVFLKSLELLESTIKNKIEFQEADKVLVEKYLKDIFEEEGSLFEDNIITLIIRQFISQLKLNEGKKNVLVIEDLDRLDPEHIFRILNVISAHFDEQKHSEFESQNKFGFDKIILVGDINNIKSVFAHKYGEGADFSGYINKFYSSEIFHYENTAMISFFIDKITDNEDLVLALKCVLVPLISYSLISLRDLIKIKVKDLNEINLTLDNLLKTKGDFYYFRKGLFTPVIFLIKNQIGSEEFKQLIHIVKKKENVLNYNYNILSRFLLGALGKELSRGNKMSFYSNNNNEDYFFVEKSRGLNNNGWLRDYSYANEIFLKEEGEEYTFTDKVFSSDDFYDLLIDNIEYCLRMKL